MHYFKNALCDSPNVFTSLGPILSPYLGLDVLMGFKWGELGLLISQMDELGPEH